MTRELSLFCVSLLLFGAGCVQSQPCGWTLDGCPANAFCEPERGVCVFSGDEAFRCDRQVDLPSPNQEQAAEFGESVALYGDHLLVAAPSLLRGVPSGATYVYRRGPESTWLNVASLFLKEAVNDTFGTSVALGRGVSAIAPGNREEAEPAVVSLAPSPLASASTFEFPRLPILDEVKGADLVTLSDGNRSVILAKSNQPKVTALVYEGGFDPGVIPRATPVPLPSYEDSQPSQVLGVAADGPWLFVGLSYRGGVPPKVWRFRYHSSSYAYVLDDGKGPDGEQLPATNWVMPWGEAGLKAIALSGGTLALSAEQPAIQAKFSPPRVSQLQADGRTWAQEEVTAPIPADLSKSCKPPQDDVTPVPLAALAISGDLLAASWDQCDAVVLFRRSTRGQWDQATLLVDQKSRGGIDRFGSALAVSQHQVVVGAANALSVAGTNNPGSAYVYSCQ